MAKKFLITSILLFTTQLMIQAQLQIKLEEQSNPLPIESSISKGNALVQIIIPEMQLSKQDISGNINIVGDLKKITGGYEMIVSTKKSKNSYIVITNPVDPSNQIKVNLTEEDHRNLFQKILHPNPSHLLSDKKYVIRLSLYSKLGLTITPTANIQHLTESANKIDDIIWQNDNQGHPMALVYLKMIGLPNQYSIEEQSGLMKGTPKEYKDGLLIWISPKKKGKTTLLIKTNEFGEIKLESKEPLKSGHQYTGEIINPTPEINLSRAFINMGSSTPCKVTITNTEGMTKYYEISTEATKINLPYGIYSYHASAPEKIDEKGSLIVDGHNFDKLIQLNNNTTLLTIQTEIGNTVKLDDQPLISIKHKDQDAYFESFQKVGLHKLTISRNGKMGLEENIKIDPGSEVNLVRHITGTLKINKPSGASIKILQNGNTIVKDKTSPYELKNAFGSYTVYGSKYGYSDGEKSININPGEKKEISLSLRRSVTPFLFLSYTYTPTAPIGIMYGFAKKWGWYLSLKTSVKFWESIMIQGSDWTFGNTSSNSLSINHAVLPGQWSDYNVDTNELIKREPVRLSATVGIVKSITWWLYVYGGLGYGQYKTLYENPNPYYETYLEYTDPAVVQDEDDKYYADKYFSTYNIKGVEADLGIMFRFSHLNLILGWTQLFNDNTMGEPILGIGFNF